MRLIDADALRDSVLKWLPPDPCGQEEKEYPFETDICVSMLQEIDEAPTVEPEPEWIPCSERMPKEDTEVIVSCTDDSGDGEFSYTTTGWHFKGVWVVGNDRSYFVRAWMPLPDPYKAESEDKK